MIDSIDFQRPHFNSILNLQVVQKDCNTFQTLRGYKFTTVTFWISSVEDVENLFPNNGQFACYEMMSALIRT